MTQCTFQKIWKIALSIAFFIFLPIETDFGPIKELWAYWDFPQMPPIASKSILCGKILWKNVFFTESTFIWLFLASTCYCGNITACSKYEIKWAYSNLNTHSCIKRLLVERNSALLGMWYPDTWISGYLDIQAILAIHYPKTKKVEISKYPNIRDIQVSMYPSIRIHRELRYPTIHVSKHWIVG